MEDSEEYDRLVWPMMISCQAFGCWPDRSELEGESSLRNLGRRSHRILSHVLLTIITVGTSAEVVVFWGIDMNDTIECSLVASALTMAVLRTFVFAGHQTDMLYVVEMMRRDWTSTGYEERLLLRDRCLLAFKLAKFFIITVAFTCLSFIFMPILEMTFADEDHKKMLPFRGYYFFNHTASPTFEIVYAMNAVVGALGCSTIAGVTSFSLITTMHAAAKFVLVQKDFEAIDSIGWVSSEKIGKYIRQHQECIKFAEKVEETINFLALAQFLVSTGLLCFAGFQITTMLEDRGRLMKYASFLNAAVTELFIFSYSGQSLKSESEDVAEFAYSSNWIGNYPGSNLQLVVMRSRKPCTITAGKFYDMSLESFLKVLSSSFSYFTVLLAMKEE